MGWFPWIRIHSEETAELRVQQLYKKARKPLSGKLSDLTQLTSLTPDVADHLHRLGGAVYCDAKGLSLREKEVAALVTSAFIGCVH